MLSSLIAEDFAATLAEGGTTIANQTTGTTFRALVTSSNESATFELGDQSLADSASATCLRADAPTTGHILIIDGATWIVSGIQSRPGSPVIRFHFHLQSPAAIHTL